MLRLVNTENGTVQGLIGKDPRITVFRGLPYAKPPVGKLRWKAPQPLDPWQDTRTCYEYGPIPMMRHQPGLDQTQFYSRELNPTAASYEMSEDCLYLNIFSPAKSVDENLPVFCYIHGGGLQDGYSYEVEFDGERLARRGVIVVMISYRLGLFGFLAHPEITAETDEGKPVSNFGMQDQSFALHWVKRNIQSFGGNPEKITLCGQSAGAGSVQCQIASPINKGLISGGICQSAVSMSFGEDEGFGRYKSLAEAEQFGADFFDSVHIENLAQAREIDATELMRRLREVSPPNEMFGLAFGLCVDGIFVKEKLAESYYNDRISDIPMIVGVCLNETKTMFGRKTPAPDLASFKEIANVYGDRKEQFLRLANVSSDDEVAALYEGETFNTFLAGSRGFCELRSSQGKKVYYYIFDHDVPGDDAGSFHGSDLWFMFDSLANSWRPFIGKHYDLARQVASYWINFVKYGDPNGEGKDYFDYDLPVWQPYRPDEKSVMMFRDKPTLESLDENPLIDFRIDFGKNMYTDKA